MKKENYYRVKLDLRQSINKVSTIKLDQTRFETKYQLLQELFDKIDLEDDGLVYLKEIVVNVLYLKFEEDIFGTPTCEKICFLAGFA